MVQHDGHGDKEDIVVDDAPALNDDVNLEEQVKRVSAESSVEPKLRRST